MGWLILSALVLVAIAETAQGQQYDGRRPPRPCGPVCMIHCEFGNVLDSNGCPTCNCNPGPGNPGPFPPTVPTPCPRGSRPITPRTVCQLSGFSGVMNTQCRPGSFCSGGAADEPGLCCKSITTPTDPNCPPDNTFTTCQITRDSCFTNRQCPTGYICCPRGCGRECVPAIGDSYRPGK